MESMPKNIIQTFLCCFLLFSSWGNSQSSEKKEGGAIAESSNSLSSGAVNIGPILQTAQEKLTANDFKEALASCSQAFELDPKSIEVRSLIAKIYMEKLEPKGRNELKAAYREKYNAFIKSEPVKAKAYSSLHQELVNLWSENPPLFSYGPGTQTIGCHYGFTDKPRLTETAEVIHAMGSDTIKFSLDKKHVSPDLKQATLLQIASSPVAKQVLDMDFRNFLLWCLPPGKKFDQPGAIEASYWDEQYKQMYELSCWLLTTYNGTGKTFCLGNWEGDWVLCGIGVTKVDPSPAQIAGTITYHQVRQAAVDAAKAATPHSNVWLYHYIEINLVPHAMAGNPRMANAVVPFTNCDGVSYSSYTLTNDKDIVKNPQRFIEGLDFIESNLPPKDIPGKRVWIGEYGYGQVGHKLTDEQVDDFTRRVMVASLKWGCPFILYWEIYDNEWKEKEQRYEGFWMIDNTGFKKPIYHTHVDYFTKARPWVEEFMSKNNRLPTMKEMAEVGVEWLKK